MSKNLFLSERGFGSLARGQATVICGGEGQPLPMRLITLPDGNIGGELIVVSERDVHARSYITTELVLYELQVILNQSLGTVRIRQIFPSNKPLGFGEDPEERIKIFIYETAFIREDEGLRLVHSEGMQGMEEADLMINGVLNKAFVAALERATTKKPDRLFYGIIAVDGTHQKRKWYTKKDKQEVTV